MGKVGHMLFGSEPEAKTRSKSTLIPEQQDLLTGTLIPWLKSQSLTPAAQGPTFPGVSLASLEQAAMQGQTHPLAGMADTNVARFTQPQDFDQFFREGIQDPLVESYQQDVLPAISRNYAPSGFYSSDRLKADDRAAEELGKNLISARAQMGFDERGRQFEASKFLDQLGYTEFARQEEQRAKNKLDLEEVLGLMFQAIFGQAKENITTVTPGSEGLIPGVIKAWASSGFKTGG